MWRSRTYRLFRDTKTKALNLSASLLLIVASIGGTLPVLLTHSANAAPGIVYANSGFGSMSFSPDRTAPSGGYTAVSNTLTLRVDNTKANTSSAFYQTEGVQSAVPTARSIKSELYVDPAWAGHPVRAGLWGVAHSDTASDLAYPIIEYTTVGNGGFTGWRVFDTINGGWTNLTGVDATAGQWHSLEIYYNAATQNYDYYIDDALAVSETAADTSVNPANTYNHLQGVIFNDYNSATTSADDYTVQWRNFQTGQAPTVGACTTVNSLKTTDLSNWYLGETRTTGHNQLLASGLHVWTEGSTSTDKAAAYYSVSFPLSSLGDQTIAQSMDYTTNAGSVAPGLQLAVDFDGNGTFDGYLVGESIYGNDWWLSNSSAQFAKDGAPHNGGGYGTQWYGTPNEWLADFPNAKVQAIGYSLGSGVYGDYTIKQISLGCTDYTFGLAAPTLATPANNGYENTNDFYFTWSDVSGNGTSPVTYEFQSDNNGTFTSPWDSITNGNSEQNHLTSPKIHSTGAPDGTYYWRVRALDSQGNPTAWSNAWKMTIDTHSPAAPTNLGWKTSTNVNVTSGGYTNVYSGTASWQGPADADHYIYKYWNNIPSSPYHTEATAWTAMVSSTSLSGVFNQGEGTHYFCVEAVDAAGNVSPCSTTFSINYDTTAPAIPTLLSPHNNAVVNGASITQSWSDTSSDIDHYVYESFNDAGATSLRWHENFNGTSKTATNVADGTVYWWHVIAVDKAGNVSAASPLRKITVDNKAPVVAITAPADGDNLRGTVTVSGTVTDVNPGHYYFVVKDSHGHVVAGPGTVNQATVADWQWDTAQVADGTYTVDLEARDAAGNKGPSSTQTITVTVDNTPPTVTENNLNISMFTGDQHILAPTVTGETGPLTYAWTVSDTHLLNDPHDTLAGQALNIGPAPKGSYTVTFIATDKAGNHSQVTTYNVTISDHSNQFKPAVLGATTGNQNKGSSGNNGQVLGDSTTTSNDTTAKGDSTGNVKGDSTTKLNNQKSDTTTNSNFLGLGWWWLLVLAVLVGFFALIGRRSNTEDKA